MSVIGAIMDIITGLVDVILAPLVPVLAPVLQLLANAIPAIQGLMNMLLAPLQIITSFLQVALAPLNSIFSVLADIGSNMVGNLMPIMKIIGSGLGMIVSWGLVQILAPIAFAAGIIQGILGAIFGLMPEDLAGNMEVMGTKMGVIVEKAYAFGKTIGDILGAVITMKEGIFNLPKKIKDAFSDFAKGLKFWQAGTPYVPETGLAILHRGEAVIPAGRKIGGNIITINPSFQVTAYSSLDIDALGEKLESQFMRKLATDLRGL